MPYNPFNTIGVKTTWLDVYTYSNIRTTFYHVLVALMADEYSPVSVLVGKWGTTDGGDMECTLLFTDGHALSSRFSASSENIII